MHMFTKNDVPPEAWAQIPSLYSCKIPKSLEADTLLSEFDCLR